MDSKHIGLLDVAHVNCTVKIISKWYNRHKEGWYYTLRLDNDLITEFPEKYLIPSQRPKGGCDD